MIKLRRLLGFILTLLLVTSVFASLSFAEEDRFSAGGYFRVAARPDFQGGWSKLGLWNISGRLLNESQWAALEMRLMLLQASPGTKEVWTSVHAKVEGGTVRAADLLHGSLSGFGLTQLYVKTGNVLIKDVVWQLGTLEYYFGDLGLYDMKFADIFGKTLGLSATYSNDYIDFLFGFGDAGYLMKGYDKYSTILSFGTALRVRPISGFEFGLGGELFYEPSNKGDRSASYQTRFKSNQAVTYSSFVRNTVVQDFAKSLADPNQVYDLYPKPTPLDALSFKLVAYLGFGQLGALRWNNLFFNFLRNHPQSVYEESYGGRMYNVYTKEWTDERYQINLGNEMQLSIVPERFDLTWAALFGYHFDKDNSIKSSETNRMIWSIVARGQVYITPTLHFLLETSFAQEKSLNGNLWKRSARSIDQSRDGFADIDGLEYGDLQLRNTWQGKTGLVINPGGTGIFARPSLRLLYGVQYSNMHNAFPNSYVETLDENNEFFGADVLSSIKDRHWHHVISIEAEAWF
ncbi:MAG: hypothetical protein WC966_00570 [Bradymonadales bacterium]|jgi:hypothetical protein